MKLPEYMAHVIDFDIVIYEVIVAVPGFQDAIAWAHSSWQDVSHIFAEKAF
jgi:hypothetical protein